VIQGGDPKGDSSGGPGYSIVETPPKDLVYEKGVVAMAKAADEAPGTSQSQFFIVTGEVLDLPPEYALVGKVTGGQDVVDKIAIDGDETEQPLDPVVMTSVKVAER
jgi:cyclophilin family peptidyl-prolyl cis-trans isomerase